MKWRAAAALVTFAVVGGIAAGIVAAAWSGTKTTSGQVNATSSSPNLHICEPNPDPSNKGCGPDDNGGTDNMANETIFEGTEDLLPGGEAWARVRLINNGDTPLTILRAKVTVGGTSPDACDVALWDESYRPENVRAFILGKWVNVSEIPSAAGNSWVYEPTNVLHNDNLAVSESYELELFQPTAMKGVYPEWPEGPDANADTYPDPGWPYAVDYKSIWGVRIGPKDYEDMAIRVRLPYDLPTECEGNAWDISIDWQVVSAGDTGTIVIKKVTDPAGDATRAGSYDYVLHNMADQTLHSVNDLLHGQSFAVTGLTPGTYEVRETAADPPAPQYRPYYLARIECDDPTSTYPGDFALVDLQPGETVTCTFKSFELGRLVIWNNWGYVIGSHMDPPWDCSEGDPITFTYQDPFGLSRDEDIPSTCDGTNKYETWVYTGYPGSDGWYRIKTDKIKGWHLGCWYADGHAPYPYVIHLNEDEGYLDVTIWPNAEVACFFPEEW